MTWQEKSGDVAVDPASLQNKKKYFPKFSQKELLRAQLLEKKLIDVSPYDFPQLIAAGCYEFFFWNFSSGGGHELIAAGCYELTKIVWWIVDEFFF